MALSGLSCTRHQAPGCVRRPVARSAELGPSHLVPPALFRRYPLTGAHASSFPPTPSVCGHAVTARFLPSPPPQPGVPQYTHHAPPNHAQLVTGV